MKALLLSTIVAALKACVGFRLWPSHRLLTRSSVIRIRRNLKRLADYYRHGLGGLPPGSPMPSTPRPGACDRSCWAN